MWSQAQWVQMNILSIQEMGVEQWLKQWLDILEGDIVNRDQRRHHEISAALSRHTPTQG
jgi:hypothetical protein